jgi:peptidoglycan DL-endopeptidase CwlO
MSLILKKIQLYLAPAVLVLLLVTTSFVAANNYDQQIQQLSNQNTEMGHQLSHLAAEAATFQGIIADLQARIDGIQSQISKNEARNRELLQEIEIAEAELEIQKSLLGASIRAMYIQGDITTIEMLAASKSLSEFVDREQYRNSVRNKVKQSVDKINELRLELKKQKDEVEALIAEQSSLRDQVAVQQGEQERLLGLNQQEQAQVDGEIRENYAKIAELRAQQARENARFIATAGTSSVCGGGYPGSTQGPIGIWGCDHPISNTIDNWGMYNRQCVSYTAFKVANSNRRMPYWGGIGNANEWPRNARAAGIPVDGTPRVGSVAISMAGYYGHSMYVEAVYGDGTILISQYNAAWDGAFSTARISPGGLHFIHFP